MLFGPIELGREDGIDAANCIGVWALRDILRVNYPRDKLSWNMSSVAITLTCRTKGVRVEADVSRQNEADRKSIDGFLKRKSRD
jgi:hypothetical protein